MRNRTISIIAMVLCLIMLILSIIISVTGSEGIFGINSVVLRYIHIAIAILTAVVMFCDLIIKNK